VQEAIDELAIETKRVTLLQREEQQLKGKQHVSRLLFVFGIADDRKTQGQVEQEFTQWRSKQEEGDQVTGVLLFLGQAGVSFLEGPAELVFKGLELIQSLATEVLPTPSLPSAPADIKSGISQKKRGDTDAQNVNPRPALIGALKILYFTELHGVRASIGWCSYASTAKPAGGGQNAEAAVDELVFMLYRKILMLCLKVKDSAGGSEADPDRLQGHYRRLADGMPTQEEAMFFLGKNLTGDFFTFPEFQNVFMKPFQLVLNSELLWPMPPALSY
jgi:hypothetical protein